MNHSAVLCRAASLTRKRKTRPLGPETLNFGKKKQLFLGKINMVEYICIYGE